MKNKAFKSHEELYEDAKEIIENLYAKLIETDKKLAEQKEQIFSMIEGEIKKQIKYYNENIFPTIPDDKLEEVDKYLKKGGYSMTGLSGNIFRVMYNAQIKQILQKIKEQL